MTEIGFPVHLSQARLNFTFLNVTFFCQVHGTHIMFNLHNNFTRKGGLLLSPPGPRVQEWLSRAGEWPTPWMQTGRREVGPGATIRTTTRDRVGQSGWKDTETTDPTQAGL